jgi:DNA-binding NarL/FixJ family response regulator
LLARGGRTRDIARTLQITPKTAGNHVQSIYAKAGVTTRAAATVFAMQHGLVDPFAE